MRRPALRLAGVAVLAMASASLLAASQFTNRESTIKNQESQSSSYVVPRTAWGDPDLQGTWPGTDLVGVPLQRNPRFDTRNVLTEQEFGERQEQFEKQQQTDAVTGAILWRSSVAR